MPYIITTKRYEKCEKCDGDGLGSDSRGLCGDCDGDGEIQIAARTAVATLDEAREAVHTQLSQTDADLNDMASFFPVECVVPESGGTVGPLPDGTVIEVERVNRDA